MNFWAKRLCKILIGNYTIFIMIKHFEKFLKLFISNSYAPMINVKSKFTLRNSTVFSIFIEITKSFQNRSPLIRNFINHQLFQLSHSIHFFTLFDNLSLLLKFDQILFIPWVFNRIMPKIKSFTLVNAATNPTTKILVIDFTFSTSVSFLHQLFEIIVVYITKFTEDFPKFINCYKAIMILI